MECYPVETIEYRGFNIEIYVDETPLHPRKEWDNLGTLYASHRRYNLCDEDIDIDDSECASWEDVYNEIVKRYNPAVIIPVYMYDHSGIIIRASEGNPFSCRWDSGQIGFVFVSKEKVQKEWEVKRISAKLKEKITK